MSRFEALLEEYETNYYLAKNASVNGKVEALNASFQKECVRQTEFMDMTDAVRSIGRWVDHYNHRRPHHGLGGLLVPADRFYGIAQYRLENPGAFVPHPGGRTGYSPGFIRTVLNHLDQWTGSLEHFCALSEVPYPTLDARNKVRMRANHTRPPPVQRQY